MDFEIAKLTDNEKRKLEQAENELGVVLIAWKKESKNNEGEYYDMYEGDRI